MKNKKETPSLETTTEDADQGLENNPQKTRVRTDISCQTMKGLSDYIYTRETPSSRQGKYNISTATLCANSFHFEHTLNAMTSMMGYKLTCYCAERKSTVFMDALSRKPEFCQVYLGNFEDMATGTLCDETYGRLGIHYKANKISLWKQLVWADFCGLASPETRKVFVDSASANFPCMAYATFNIRAREGQIDDLHGYTNEGDQETIITQGLKIELEQAMKAKGLHHKVKIIYSVKYAGGGAERCPMLTVGYACGIGNDLPAIIEDRTKASHFNYKVAIDKHIKQANPSGDTKWLQARQIINRMHPAKVVKEHKNTIKVKATSPAKAYILQRTKWILSRNEGKGVTMPTKELNKWVYASVSQKYPDVSLGSVGSIICTNLTKTGSWDR
jgi:hypothetical protein